MLDVVAAADGNGVLDAAELDGAAMAPGSVSVPMKTGLEGRLGVTLGE